MQDTSTSSSDVLSIRPEHSQGTDKVIARESNNYGEGSVCINFAPGPMGLELQPVIVSSEREIGCRVRDYYFGLDYNGISEEALQNSISIGDIITHIDDRNIQSAKFTDILELLRSLKDSDRRIVFKNVSTSCELQQHLFIANVIDSQIDRWSPLHVSYYL